MRALLLIPLILAACVQAEEKDAPYYWKLVAIDGQPFEARATLAIEDTRAFGQGPCNAWSGEVQREPFPEWRIRNVVATEMACDDLAAETAFFTAMANMTHSSVGLGYLTLVDQKGRKMEFIPLQP